MKIPARTLVDFQSKRFSQETQKIRARQNKSSVTSVFVRALARREGVLVRNTFADNWAQAVTRLAGDSIKSDTTDDRLVALARAGKISASQQLGMLVAHHRRARVRSV
jgi:hypothetical protein